MRHLSIHDDLCIIIEDAALHMLSWVYAEQGIY
jgi:hypothetical protein